MRRFLVQKASVRVAGCAAEGGRPRNNVGTGPTYFSTLDGLTENDGYENDGHEIAWRTRHISFENRLHYNAVCNSFQNNGRIQVIAAR